MILCPSSKPLHHHFCGYCVVAGSLECISFSSLLNSSSDFVLLSLFWKLLKDFSWKNCKHSFKPRYPKEDFRRLGSLVQSGHKQNSTVNLWLSWITFRYGHTPHLVIIVIAERSFWKRNNVCIYTVCIWKIHGCEEPHCAFYCDM